ncbi:LOW QUALITY PROTEIN: hypothetical protein Cgig2_000927 [Carnegiea gigantea]|uniref:Reverse transcriptase n=1 Tax=Carnegiea gigantea TaxID=171969 RepID=A0A9Q1QN29_9CARY|nr:LOW QUALITY PROTEIN: hypothetical protein Cgig2_000927 [Carnegiea gigantea]
MSWYICWGQGDEIWRFTGTYCHPDSQNEIKTCELLLDLKAHWTLPWLIRGDLNEILFNFKKNGGPLKPPSVLDAFNKALVAYDLFDISYSGHKYTWWIGQGRVDSVKERLDRFCANSGWSTLFPDVEVTLDEIFQITFLPSLTPSSCIMSAKNLVRYGKHPAENYCDKLRDTVDIHSRKALFIELSDLRKKEEIYWWSRTNFLKFGDDNSSWFHHRANARKCINHIASLQGPDGRPNFFKLITPKDPNMSLLRVGDLIDWGKKHWNVDMLNALFLPADVETVLSIPFYFHWLNDKLT